VACARCHDHKFDPISTRDYYALAGVFASIRRAELSLLPADVDARARKARARVRVLQSEIRKAREEDRLAELKAEVARLRATPGYDSPPAVGVEDASLLVLPDGPDKTKLVYKPGVGQDVPIHLRGNAGAAGALVPRRFLAVLSAGRPRRFTQGSG